MLTYYQCHGKKKNDRQLRQNRKKNINTNLLYNKRGSQEY